MKVLFKIFVCIFMLAATAFAARQAVTAPPDTEETQHRRYLVVIDAGHGGGEWGVSLDGVYEKDINLKLAKLTAEKIKESGKGISVVLTRDSDAYLKEEERAGLANNKRADIYVSIHCDYAQERVNGYKIYYFSGDNDNIHQSSSGIERWEDVQYRHETASEKLAETMEQYMQAALIPENSAADAGNQENNVVPLADRGTTGTYVEPLVGLDMPAVLIETGNLNNRNNFADLKNPKIQDIIAYHIKEGIVNYLKGK